MDFLSSLGIGDQSLSGIGVGSTATPSMYLPSISGASSLGSTGGSSGLTTGLNTAQSVLGGLQSLGSLWGGMQALSLANKQYNMNKQLANINLGNQTKSYNTQLSDVANARGVAEGQTQSQINNYINQNKLSNATVG